MNEKINQNSEIKKTEESIAQNKYSNPDELKNGDEKYLVTNNNLQDKTLEKEVQHSFLNEKVKEENFKSFENKFLSLNKGEIKKEYNIQELAKNFENISNPGETNKILNSLPKEIIMKIAEDSQNYKAINAIKEWQQKVGGQISNLSNQRVDYFDNSNKKEIIKLGTIPENPKDYLEVTANAARFAPKEVSEKFVKDAVDVFLDKNKLVGSGMTSFVKNFGQGSGLNIVRNLCESGYKEEAKKLLLESLKEETKLNMKDRLSFGNSNLIFDLTKDNIFSKEEIQEMFNESGYLEEKQEDTNNSSWG